jgi:hypothetical protein
LKKNKNRLPKLEQKKEHNFIIEIKNFLIEIEEKIKNLPKEKKESIYFQTFQFISNNFMNLITNKIKKINFFSIQNLQKDLDIIENSASNINEKCYFCFIEIRQIIDFIIQEKINPNTLNVSLIFFYLKNR